MLTGDTMEEQVAVGSHVRPHSYTPVPPSHHPDRSSTFPAACLSGQPRPDPRGDPYIDGGRVFSFSFPAVCMLPYE